MADGTITQGIMNGIGILTLGTLSSLLLGMGASLAGVPLSITVPFGVAISLVLAFVVLINTIYH